MRDVLKLADVAFFSAFFAVLPFALTAPFIRRLNFTDTSSREITRNDRCSGRPDTRCISFYRCRGKEYDNTTLLYLGPCKLDLLLLDLMRTSASLRLCYRMCCASLAVSRTKTGSPICLSSFNLNTVTVFITLS